MKKVLFSIFFLLFVFSYNANSQILIGLLFGDKLNTDRLKMGFSVGDNLTTLTNIKGKNYSSNLVLGLDLKVMPKSKLSLHTGIFFSAPASKKGLPVGSTGDANLDTVLQDTDVKLKLSYLSLPLYAKYNLWKGLSVELGTTLAYLRKAKLEHTFSNSDLSLNYTEQILDEFNRFDIQAGAGIAYAFKDGKGTRINIRYVRGLLDVFENNNRKVDASQSVYNQAFQFLVEIPIKGVKDIKE